MDELDPNPPRRREGTGRRVVAAMNNDKFHKGLNWTTLLGVAGTAVMGYLADGSRGEKQEQLASGAAREIAAMQEWRDGAKAQLSAQAEQIVQLRLAVGALKAANEAVAASYGRGRTGARIRDAIDDVEIAPEIGPEAPSPVDDGPDEERVRKLKESLEGEDP